MEIDNKHMQQEHEHEHSPTHIYKHENYPKKKKVDEKVWKTPK